LPNDEQARQKYLIELREKIMKAALKKGWDLVLPAEQLLYYNNTLDISQEDDL